MRGYIILLPPVAMLEISFGATATIKGGWAILRGLAVS
jgi:hypothetical protein